MHDQEIDIVGWPGQDFVPGARLSSSGDYEFIYETVEQPVTVLRSGRNSKRFVPCDGIGCIYQTHARECLQLR